ncbi:MAG: hypothetical protein P8J33_01695 [Pirellulaceae bacterium]|nr:hypothetical protein [Pirellulaceae bacterium]
MAAQGSPGKWWEIPERASVFIQMEILPQILLEIDGLGKVDQAGLGEWIAMSMSAATGS